MLNSYKNRKKHNHKVYPHLFLTLSILFLLAGCSDKPTSNDYLEQGLRFMSENNYEEAIIAFSNAIEIEDNAAARKARADAYAATDQYENAVSDYLMLIDLDPQNEDAYHSLINLYLLNGDYDNALYWTKQCNSDFGLTEEESVILRSETLFSELIAANDNDLQIIDILKKYELFNRNTSLMEKNFSLVRPGSPGVGLYFLGRGGTGVYIGDMAGTVRSGFGSWYLVSSSVATKGIWVNDVPNGAFEVIKYSPNGVQTDKGEVKNGLWEGTVIETTVSGNVFEDSYTNGIINVIDVKTYNGQTIYETGRCINNPNVGNHGYSDSGFLDKTYGVPGFADRS